MSEPISFPFDEETFDNEPRGKHFMSDWSEESFREYCNTALTLIGSAVDDMTEEVSDIKRDIRSIRQELDDDFQAVVSPRESVESLSEDVMQLRRSVNRTFTCTAVCSAALLGAAGAILVSVSSRKRR